MNMGDSDEEEKPWSEQSNNASEIAEVSNRNSSEQEIVDLDNIEKYFELLPQVNPFDEMNAIYDSKVSYLLEDMDDSTKSSKEENYYPKEKNQNEEMKARVDTDPLEDKNYCSNQNATDDADCKMEKNNEMEIDDNGDLKNKENKNYYRKGDCNIEKEGIRDCRLALEHQIDSVLKMEEELNDNIKNNQTLNKKRVKYNNRISDFNEKCNQILGEFNLNDDEMKITKAHMIWYKFNSKRRTIFKEIFGDDEDLINSLDNNIKDYKKKMNYKLGDKNVRYEITQHIVIRMGRTLIDMNKNCIAEILYNKLNKDNSINDKKLYQDKLEKAIGLIKSIPLK